MAEDSVIHVDKVSKDFILPHERVTTVKSAFTGFYKRKRTREVQHALKNISFEIKKGEFFGIVGRNGSGKSTLLKILAGIYQPSKGKVNTYGKIVPFIELGVGFNPELSGRDNVYLNGALFGFSKAEVDRMYDDIVTFAELERFMDQKLKNYSSGMQVRLAFSLAIKAEADILLIDEVLAVGDAAFQQKCLNYFYTLKKNQKTVIFVSHDMDAVEQFCDRAVVVDNSKLVFEGSAHDAANYYKRQFAEEIEAAGAEGGDTQRWGDQKAVFTDFELKKTPEEILIDTTIKFNESAENVVCGISIIGNAQRLVGTNTHIEGIKLEEHLGDKEKLKVRWRIPNIFPNGTYSVTLGLNSPGLGLTHDWVEGALHFKIMKTYTTYHTVEPRIQLEIKDNQ